MLLGLSRIMNKSPKRRNILAILGLSRIMNKSPKRRNILAIFI